MAQIVCHVTTLHPRDDIRIFFKECTSLAEKSERRVSLIVADGLGGAIESRVEIVDVGKSRGGRVRRTLESNLRVFKKIRDLKPNIVHVHDPELIFLAFVLRVLGFVVVYDMHENLPKQVRTKEWLPKFTRRFVEFSIRCIERVFLPSMAVVFAETSYAKDYLWLKRTEVILNLPRLSALLSIEAKGTHEARFCYIGGVSAQRGAVVTLQALKLVRESGIKADFVCVGSIESDVVENELYSVSTREGWARFYGRRKPVDGWSLISGSVGGLAVLAPSPNYVESFPTKIFEYMALGIPVIASDFPLYRNIVEKADCGILVDPMNSRSVSEAMSWILENPELARLMGERGKRFVRELYSWEGEAQKLEDFYEKITPSMIGA